MPSIAIKNSVAMSFDEFDINRFGLVRPHGIWPNKGYTLDLTVNMFGKRPGVA